MYLLDLAFAAVVCPNALRLIIYDIFIAFY